MDGMTDGQILLYNRLFLRMKSGQFVKAEHICTCLRLSNFICDEFRDVKESDRNFHETMINFEITMRFKFRTAMEMRDMVDDGFQVFLIIIF